MEWVYRGSYPYITGILVNDSGKPLSGVSVNFNLYAADDTVVGTASDFVEVLPVGERWRFSCLVWGSMVATPVYAKPVSVRTGLDDHPVTDPQKAWDPVVLQRRAEIEAQVRKQEAKHLKAEEKARIKAEKKAKKDESKDQQLH